MNEEILSKADRHKIYQLALELLKVTPFPGTIGLCHILNHAAEYLFYEIAIFATELHKGIYDEMNLGKLDYQGLFWEINPMNDLSLYSEVYKHKPSDWYNSAYWFGHNQGGRDKRINILEQAFKESA